VDRADWLLRLLNLIDAAGLGDPDEWGTYVLWDRDPEHPMKVGLSLCPRRRMGAIRPHVPWPIEIVLVVPLDLEHEFMHSFQAADLPYEMKHGGWMEWYLDPALVELVEGFA
jgi:hypothetical protein